MWKVLMSIAVVLFVYALIIFFTSDYTTYIDALGPYGSDVRRWRPDNPIWFWITMIASAVVCCLAMGEKD